jgi:hypothetical protein
MRAVWQALGPHGRTSLILALVALWFVVLVAIGPALLGATLIVALVGVLYAQIYAGVSDDDHGW